MTCIAGIAHEGRVYIGGDSATLSGWLLQRTQSPKVFRNGEFLIGVTGTMRLTQILRYHLVVPPQAEDDQEAYMVKVFAEAVRTCLKAQGWAKVDNNREESEGAFLVGYRGGLYSVYSDYQVFRSLDGVDACGSGREYALAAMYVLAGLPPRERIERALEASAYYCIGVSAPFQVLEM